MKKNHIAAGLLAVAATAASATAIPAQAAPEAAAPAAASAAASTAASTAKLGTTSLAEVLAADGTKFDKVGKDFDIAEAAILAVLKADPKSPLKILTQGNKRVTVFIPTDKAFETLVTSLTGKAPKSEAATVEGLVGLVGIDTIQNVLLYHAVVGATLTSDKVLAAKGTKVETALGESFRVKIKGGVVSLVDKDPDARDPHAIPALLDLNKGNKQVAHGIDRVLRPADL